MGHLVRQTGFGDRIGQQHQHTGATRFFFTIDGALIQLRILGQAPFGLGQHRFALAKIRRARGTNAGAGRGHVLGHAMHAHVAFADARIAFVPFVSRHAKRAGHHAIATAHAFFSVPGHWTKFRFFQRPHRTNRSAGRMFATHTQVPGVLVVAQVFDPGERLVIELVRFVRTLVVLGLAALFTGSAADAQALVEKKRVFGHDFSLSMAPTVSAPDIWCCIIFGHQRSSSKVYFLTTHTKTVSFIDLPR